MKIEAAVLKSLPTEANHEAGEASSEPSSTPQSGFTLIETLLAITIAGIILVPVMAWSILALNKSNDHRLTDGTMATAMLNRYLKSDVAGSYLGAEAGSASALKDCSPAVAGGSVKLALWSGRDSVDQTLTTYVQASAGVKDPENPGKELQVLLRRQCGFNADTGPGAVRNTSEVVGGMSSNDPTGTISDATFVSCAARTGNTIDNDACGEVAMTVNTSSGIATVKASRRIDPALDLSSDRRPVAVITCNPICPSTGKRAYTVSFDSSSSYDPNGIQGVSWDFGDGSPTVGDRAPVHVFTNLGSAASKTFNVKLTVVNAVGLPAFATTQITVYNAVPVAVATPASVITNRVDYVQFSAAGSVDPDATTPPGLTYRWDFGDGTSSTQMTPTNGHRYSYTGYLPPDGVKLTASLTVTDANGASDTQYIPVVVKNKLPISCFATVQTSPPAASPNAADKCDTDPYSVPNAIRSDVYPITITFNAQSRDDDGFVAARLWSVQDDSAAPVTIGNGLSITRTFTLGIHTVILETVDNDGGRSTYAMQVAVNAKPTALINYSIVGGGSSGSSGGGTGTPPPNGCTANTRPVTCTFDASSSFDPDGTIVKYVWDFADGTTATQTTPAAVTHSWNDYGTYFVTLTITDNSGATSTASVRVKVNQPPTAVLGPSGALNPFRKLPFNFVGSGSTDDPTGTIVSYLWTFGEAGATSNLPDPTFTYQTLGTKTVSLKVTDDDGASTTVSRTVNIQNQSPVANLVTPRNSAGNAVSQGLTTQFGGDTSYDPDGNIVSYAWSFGDGTTSTDANPLHVYTGYGTYTIRLTVTDNDGAATTQQVTMKVNQLPVASFSKSLYSGTLLTPDFAINPPITMDYSGAGSSDQDGTIVRYSWDFGPGFVGAYGTSPTIRQPYTTRGVFFVTLTVTDNDGGSSSATQQVLIIDQTPVSLIDTTPAIDPVKGYAVVNSTPNTFTFSPVRSYDADGTITSYRWNFGDGTSATTATASPVSHTYPAGVFTTYNVTLTTTDNYGVPGDGTVQVKVNKPPTATIVGSTPLSAGRNIPYKFSSSAIDTDGTIADTTVAATSGYVWNFGDPSIVGGGTAYGSSPTNTYKTIGLYTVTLTVTDNDGKSFTTTKQINTSNAPPVASVSMNGGATTVTRLSSKTSIPPWNVTFDASSSYDPDVSTLPAITNYTIDFGDGTPVSSSASAVVTHTYNSYGTFTVTLTVTDQGGATNTITKTVKVNRQPTAIFNPSTQIVLNNCSDPAPVGCYVGFDGTISTDGDGDAITRYDWNIGEKTLSNAGGTPQYGYRFPGNLYNVTMTITDADGGVTSLTKTALIKVNKSPTAVISYPSAATSKVITSPTPYTWNFTSAATDTDGAIASYLWDFGDGSTSTAANPSKTYAASGTYTVRLTVTDNNGATGTTTVVVKANVPPVAKIGPTTLDPKVNLPFTFDGTGSTDSDGTIASYSWTFPGATPATSTVAKPAVTWTTGGSRTVTLTVTDSDGATNTTTRTVDLVANVKPIPVFTTTPSPASGASNPFTVGVDATTSTDPDGTIVAYAWDFGDGSTATGATASHNYTAYGRFVITLTVTDNSGDSVSATANVRNNQPPIASVATAPNNPVFNDPPWVVFFDASASKDLDGTIVSYTWNFADGTSATGLSTTHTFTARGIFNVTLTIVDNEGASTVLTVPVKVNKPPTAVPAFSPASAPRLSPITFDALGSTDPDGTIIDWQWDFGDGSTGAGLQVQHFFIGLDSDPSTPALDPYLVRLTVTDNDGGTATTVIPVQTSNQAPVAAILTSPNPPVGDPGLSVNFDGGQSYDPDGTLTSYSWDFGDGTTATGITPPAHVYNAYGTYQAVLTVTDNLGAQSSIAQAVKVNRPPTATIGAVSPTRGIPVTFAGSGSDADGTVVSYRWDFDDGASAISNSQNPTYSYHTFGNKTVRLTVTDNDGRSNTVTRAIYVANQLPVANITASAVTPTPTILKGAGPLTINFDGSTSSDPDNILDDNPAVVIASYSWAFGDGQTGTGATVSHQYTGVGTYSARLTATDSDGGQTTTSITVQVVANTPPTARITANPPSGPATSVDKLTVSFDGTGSTDSDGTITSYQWNFGDGTTASGATASHAYTPGQWTVTLTVTDNSGATNTASTLIPVSGLLPNPTGLRYTGGKLDFAWDAVPGATRYVIVASDNGNNNFAGLFCGSSGNRSGSFNAPATSGTVGGGSCYRDYSVQITAYNGSEAGYPSPPISVSTGP